MYTKSENNEHITLNTVYLEFIWPDEDSLKGLEV